ncbi:MAG: hypothetical protein KC800_11965 [Candidatus Eremiobacteraeota bacterium]|nr:hypothetical protein [Candidatus Eremiobacteraeota bacterium]
MDKQNEVVRVRRRRGRPRHYVAATLFAFLAVAGFFWVGTARIQDPERLGQQEVRVVDWDEQVAFSERAEYRLDQMKEELGSVEPAASEGELAMEIDAIASEISDLDDELGSVDETLSPAEKERIETTLTNLERRVQSLNSSVSLLEIEPLAP